MRYAKTVKSGERPLIVWTRETGIWAVAVELRMWPRSWKTARGSAVLMTSLLGYLIPCLSAGTAVFRAGKRCARYAEKIHQPETKANWTMLRVTGCGKALRMDFEDVFVRAEVMYQITHSVYNSNNERFGS